MGNVCNVCGCCCQTEDETTTQNKDAEENNLADPLLDQRDHNCEGTPPFRTCPGWNWKMDGLPPQPRRAPGLPPLAPRPRCDAVHFAAPGTLERTGYAEWKKANAYLLNYHRLSYEATMKALREDERMENLTHSVH
ncbi:MAG: hypothetical protein K0U52_06640 [Gammaproteobacteria bacterium]|nr:hypothetical protein [Gammaproteobacteria bacterium]